MDKIDYFSPLRKKKNITNNTGGLKNQMQSQFKSNRDKSWSFCNKIHDGDARSILMCHKHAEVNIT